MKKKKFLSSLLRYGMEGSRDAAIAVIVLGSLLGLYDPSIPISKNEFLSLCSNYAMALTLIVGMEGLWKPSL